MYFFSYSLTNKTVSPELKSKICDPNNPKLRFVNTTESNICGVPKTIKNVTSTTSIIPTPSETNTGTGYLDYHNYYYCYQLVILLLLL